jgi:DnaJ-class molecular chaperone
MIVLCPACDGTRVEVIDQGDDPEMEPCLYCDGTGKIQQEKESTNG